MADGVFVLGMHRSGTSAATRLVSLLGPRLPREDDLVHPDERNPTGYWESVSLVAFTNRVLWAVGSDMRCPLALEPGWSRDARLDALRAEAQRAVDEAFGGTPWVWKDPRTCLALEFWREALEVRPVAVLVHRNPLEIASSSLRARRSERKLYTLALWERYLRQAVLQLEGLPTLVTRHDDLLADPLEWCGKARAFLEAAGIPARHAPVGEVSSFVDPSLGGTRRPADELLADPEVTAGQRELFLALERAVGEHEALSLTGIPPETPTTEALLAERREAIRGERELLERFADERSARWDARLRRSALLGPVRALYSRARAARRPGARAR